MIPAAAPELECLICLEPKQAPELVVLNCDTKHEMCLKCAQDIFGNIKEGIVEKSALCPWRCARPVTSYTKKITEVFNNQVECTKSSQEVIEREKPRRDNRTDFALTLSLKIVEMIRQNYTDEEINDFLQASYQRHKHPYLSYPVS